jgi:hypothetical protein
MRAGHSWPGGALGEDMQHETNATDNSPACTTATREYLTAED